MLVEKRMQHFIHLHRNATGLNHRDTDVATLKISQEKIADGQTHANHETQERTLTTNSNPHTWFKKRVVHNYMLTTQTVCVFVAEALEISFDEMFCVTQNRKMKATS